MKEDSILKERFFAQYWGQKVQYYSDYKEIGSVSIDSMFPMDNDHLLLTSLSAITDEHAIEVAKIWFNDVEKITLPEENQINYVRNNVRFGLMKNLEVTDFLRSKGYALPFSGKSVEQLIEMGYLKLREMKKGQTTLKQFIKAFVRPNTLIRLWIKAEEQKYVHRMVFDRDKTFMEHQLAKDPKWKNRIVDGVTDILVTGPYSEAVNIVIKRK